MAYRTALNARGTSYLVTAFNYGLGQGVMAWRMGRAQGISLLSALGRCFLLAVHDIAVLMSLGLLASLTIADPRVQPTRLVCGFGLLGLAGAAAAWWMFRRARKAGRWAELSGWWGLRRSARLCLLRGVYFSISLTYATLAFALCGVGLSLGVVFSVGPLVLLADGLPISISGLGTRETALQLLLNPEKQGEVLALSLIWSAGLLTGRLAIGLVHLWLLSRPAVLPAAEPERVEAPV